MVSGSSAADLGASVAATAPDAGQDADAVLRRSAELVADGRRDEAIDLLTTFDVAHRPPEVARRILQLRHEAFADVAGGPGRAVWPPDYDDLFADVGAGSLPEIAAADLSAEAVGAGILHHGSLIVRDLVDGAAVTALVEQIDLALAAAQTWLDGASPDETAPWFEIFTPSPPFSVGLSRRFVVQGGGVLGPDSPLAMCAVIDVLEGAGVRPVLTEYLGERPALSAKKTTLRRVPPDSGSDWHQDGAFLGADVRTVNIWLSLSHCGVDAPGLDVVARRLDLVDTGTEGAIFDWSVGRPVVDRAAGPEGVVRPVFRPGDALLFDDRNLHATACAPEMQASRYAVEAWCFAPSQYPADQVPLVF
jgi:hypothetical protein